MGSEMCIRDSFESELARALGDADVAPSEQAELVAEACEAGHHDAASILEATWESGSPVIALVQWVENQIDDEEAKHWVHRGATTQDVVDTAQMLMARSGLQALETSLTESARLLVEILGQQRDTPQMGRTFLQHAIPTSFGARLARWIDSILGHIVAFRRLRGSLAVQLGGPVGDLASYGAKGLAVRDALARRLELDSPDVSWHTDRTRVRAISDSVSRMVASLAKIAMDVVLLAQSDTAEVRVRAGGSSSMKHKRNPIDPMRALAASDVSRGAAGILSQARPHELERGAGGWQAEWVALPLLFESAAAVCDAIEATFRFLDVDEEAMSGRVDEPATIDDSQIDRVIEKYNEIVGEA